jgi:hypothetical protein
MTDIKDNPQSMQVTSKIIPVRMVALSIILAVTLIFIVVMYFDQKNKMVEMEIVLTHEKDSLANELRLMVAAYDTMKTNNDSLNASLEKEKKRIIQLLSINASNVQLIKKYRGEIGTMREIMKSYIVQIDSLNTRNKLLVAENTQIRQEITEVQNINFELEKTKETLSSKVEVASVIQAKNIVAATLNDKRKETNRLSLVENLRVCFTLRENPIVQAGQKVVFMRIIRPDSLVITSSPDNLFDYKENKLIYSANRSADYMNQDLEMCIFLANTGDFVAGNYSVELYLDNNIIGRTSFMLTKR